MRNTDLQFTASCETYSIQTETESPFSQQQETLEIPHLTCQVIIHLETWCKLYHHIWVHFCQSYKWMINTEDLLCISLVWLLRLIFLNGTQTKSHNKGRLILISWNSTFLSTRRSLMWLLKAIYIKNNNYGPDQMLFNVNKK